MMLLVTIKLFIIFIFLLFIALSESARILGVVPSASFSHQIVFRPIWRELAKRGHDLVVITTDPENDPTLNIKEIDISFAYDLWNVKYNFMKKFEENQNNPYKLMNVIRDTSIAYCDEELMHPEIQKLLKNDTEHFDLIILEFFYPIMSGLAERFKCPFIGVTSFDMPNIIHSDVGNPIHPVAYPDVLLPFEGGKMNFLERLLSFFFNVFMKVNAYVAGDEKEKVFLEKHFGKGLPPLIKITQNFSIILNNANPAFSVRPSGPAIINIGDGMHLRPLKPLPQDLQLFMNSSKNGVIYFSLGTNVNKDRVPPSMRDAILGAFKELPYDILWKFDNDIPEAPKNVKIVRWAPQQDILRHPKTKLFITQGGLQSLEEAMFFNVPLVAIPFFADQYSNVLKYVSRGFGVYLDKLTLTQESFKKAIDEVINNPAYKINTIEAARLTKDQPMSGIEKAVWWTEYVIRNKGARNFRNPMMDLPFYQLYLLDILGFLFLMIVVFLYTFYKAFSLLKLLIKKRYYKKLKTV